MPGKRNSRQPRAAARLVLYWAPLIGWMAAIFLLSNTTSATIESRTADLPPIVARATVVHMLEFGVLAVLFYRLLTSYRVGALRWVWIGASLLAVSYGVIDEIHQAYVPGRVASISDVGYDTLGALIGTGVAEAAVRFARIVRRPPEAKA